MTDCYKHQEDYFLKEIREKTVVVEDQKLKIRDWQGRY